MLVTESKKLTITQKLIATDHDHDKYITTQDFNKLISESFTARLKKANLGSKSYIANFIKRQILITN